MFPIPPAQNRQAVLRADPINGYLQFRTQTAQLYLADSENSLPSLLYGGQLNGSEINQKSLINDAAIEVGFVYLKSEMSPAQINEKVTVLLLSRACENYAESDLVAGDSNAYQTAI